MTTDSWTTTEYLNFIGPDYFIFGLVLVSHDFEVGTNVSCEESTVSPRTGLIFQFWFFVLLRQL